LGNGLVYNVGERVHSFTSPLGTIIPALLSYIGGPDSDEFAIWSYRFLCTLLLSYTGVQLFNFFKKLGATDFNSYWVVGLFTFNILIVDFSINGMETAFMMLFLTRFIYLMLIPDGRLIRKLAICMAALMYTRPDAFVYFGSIIFGFFLFNPNINSLIINRKKFLIVFLKAGILAIIFYLPWIIGTYLYYESPIPHTIIAKGAMINYSIKDIFISFITFPFTLIKFECAAANNSFMPPYSGLGSWSYLYFISGFVVLATALCFIALRYNRNIKALSIALFLSLFYLHRISGQGPMPWYLPNIAILSIICLGLFVHYKLHNNILSRSIQIALILFFLFIFLTAAYSLKKQQQIIEFSHRKQIGIWLKNNSKPGQTVFLECLGYIGFYSNLKTYDYPGMSSPEVVAVRKNLPPRRRYELDVANYAFVIQKLKPDWLVLRPYEIDWINNTIPSLLSADYKKVKAYDVSKIIPRMLGENYLKWDQRFLVYKRN
jgi:hypothetical protein